MGVIDPPQADRLWFLVYGLWFFRSMSIIGLAKLKARGL
jgi:hypothetical protein